jgi:hypothetical protein
MSNTPVQLGTALEVGIGDYTYTGNIVQGVDHEPTANEEIVYGEDLETTTVIITDPARNFTLNVLGKSGTAIESLKIGDRITVNSVICRVTAAPVTRSAGKAISARITVRKEASMTYTA